MNSREKTRPVQIGNLTMGGNNDVLVQSMCSIKTDHVDEVVEQILALEEQGCQLIRVSVLDENDAQAIEKIKEKIHIPLVADIHFDYRLALKAIEAGADKIRLNPGNIGRRENVEKVVRACKEHHVPIRIGINSGSLEPALLKKYGKPSAEAMVESARGHVKILEDLDFHDIVLSFKSSNPNLCIEAYELADKEFDYPLHLGVTEAGTELYSAIKSAYALGHLLHEGIGSTIRISVHGDPQEEIPIARELLKDVGLIRDVADLVACPTCGRTAWQMEPVVRAVEEYLKKVKKPLKVAVMGCVVNGPGEAREADFGVAGGNQQAVLIKKGKVIETLPQEKVLERLIEEIDAFEPDTKAG